MPFHITETRAQVLSDVLIHIGLTFVVVVDVVVVFRCVVKGIA